MIPLKIGVSPCLSSVLSFSVTKESSVQKVAGAIQNRRRDRDREYCAKAEAEERLRLAHEEEQALAKIVADLKAKHEKIVKAKESGV
jgi:hypothetical protein